MKIVVKVIRHHVAPAPSGCRWCGVEASRHGRRYVSSQGVHAWEEPTSGQKKARFRVRKAAGDTP